MAENIPTAEKIIRRSEKRKISDLKPFEGNPRKATEKEIKDLTKSLEKFNLADPLIINTNNEVIGGNFRLRLLKQKGIKEIDVRVPSRTLTREEAEELNLRLNKNLGLWDNEILANFSEELLKEVGWSGEELDDIFGIEMEEEFDEQKEFEKVIKHPRGCKSGDIWQLGEHKLIIGDCTKKENWERLLGNERFDFLFTDPPYRIGYGISTRKQKTKEGFKLQRFRTYPKIGITTKEGKPLEIQKSSLKSIKYFGAKGNRGYLGVDIKKGIPEYDEWLSIANEHQNPKGANVMIFENWRNTVALWQAIEKYWKIRNQIIWHLPNRHQGFSRPFMFYSKYDIAPLAGDGKINEEYEEEFHQFLQSKGQKLINNYEILFYANKGGSEFSKIKGKRFWTLGDHITWTAETESSSGQNIIFGTKPIQILVPYIKILSPRNGIVMDCFGGSGSTLIACEIMKRKCRMIEIAEIYSEIILNRFEKFSGQKAKKIGEAKF